MRASLLVVTFAALFAGLVLCAACDDGSDAPDDACRPLDTVCRGRAIMICHADPDWLRKGKTVYVLEEAESCDDDSVLGAARCVETKTSTGGVDAECEYED